MKKRGGLNTTHIILASFLVVILLGSLLLYLPISAAEGVKVSYTDALFTATTSTCVTGLVTLPTADTWSVFGQAVILLLIQVLSHILLQICITVLHTLDLAKPVFLG